MQLLAEKIWNDSTKAKHPEGDLINKREPQRCLITGDPKSGKSLLLEMSARDLAGIGTVMIENSSQNHTKMPLPLVVPLNFIAERATPSVCAEELREIIREWLDTLPLKPEVVSYLVAHIEDRRSYLMLDDLDKVPVSSLRGVFKTLRNWKCNVFVTSVPIVDAGVDHSFWNESCELYPFSPTQVHEFLDRWFPSGYSRCPQVSQFLGQMDLPSQGEASPFILTLISSRCKFKDGDELLNESDGKLLKGAILDALDLSAEDAAAEGMGHLTDLFSLLAEIAWAYFCDTNGQEPLRRYTIQDVVSVSEHAPSFGKPRRSLSLTQVVDRLLTRLCDAGLLTPADKKGWAHNFTIQAIAKLLTAHQLALLIIRGEPIGVRFPSDSARKLYLSAPLDFACAKAWRPSWEGVIVYLAGLIGDPTELLDRLLSSGDDRRHHRLALAARCLSEIRREIGGTATDRCQELIIDIRDRLLKLWHDSMSSDADLSAPVARALPMVVSCFPESSSSVILPLLRGKRPSSLRRVLLGIRHAGVAALTDGVLARLHIRKRGLPSYPWASTRMR
ncbi:MAG: hypothetical protein NTY19_23990 [Planctomycetota bacterium]|nr:hypothetical protein [Planctomycetota bacterium]